MNFYQNNMFFHKSCFIFKLFLYLCIQVLAKRRKRLLLQGKISERRVLV